MSQGKVILKQGSHNQEARDNGRALHLRHARWLEVGTISYNVIEAGVTVTVGLINGSAALVSFGLDASVEAISATALLWRIVGEERGVEQGRLNRRKLWSFNVLSVVFVLLAGFILYDSIGKLVNQQHANFSIVAVSVLIASLLINPFLAFFKRRAGRRLDSTEIVLDSREQLICLYMTVVVLVGMLLTKYLNLWWADPVAALLIVPYVLSQALESAKRARRFASIGAFSAILTVCGKQDSTQRNERPGAE